MFGYGLFQQLFKNRTRKVLCATAVVYLLASYLHRPPLKAKLAIELTQIEGDYITMAQYHDKSLVIEHIAFNSNKDEKCQEKIIRKAILVRRPHAKATVLMCHGFGCDKQDMAILRMMFPEYNIMTFDFRAHGQNNEGQYCTLGHDEVHDVIAAARVLKIHPKTKNKPVLAYGFSMGAVSAIGAQAQDGNLFKAMILDCPFDSVEKLIRRGLDNFKVSIFGYEVALPGRTLLEKCAFNKYTQPIIQALLKVIAGIDARQTPVTVLEVHAEENIRKVTVPCFFIACKNDEKVPVSAMRQVFNNAGTEYKKLWITGGRRHFDSLFHEPERYVRKIQNFVNLVVNNQIEKLPKGKISDDSDHPRAEVF